MNDLHSLTQEEILYSTNSSLNGLDELEVKKRQEDHGMNVLPKPKKNTILEIFISQFNNPLTIILLVTVVISFLIKEYVDAIFIILVITLDAILGTFEEWKAEESASALEELVDITSVVVRNHVRQEISSEELVIGDIVVVEPGNKVAADMIILESTNLTADEAFLTGESNASEKNNLPSNGPLTDRHNVLYSGSVILTGYATCVVVGTGSNTEIGNIARNVILTKSEKTPIVVRMEQFSKDISMVVLVLSMFLAFVLFFKEYPLKEIFFLVVALAVSAIPEGLPMSLTVALSIATRRMSKRNVIVRKLNAVEALGSCTVIASDKTGTLTLNEQTIKGIYLMDGSIYSVSGTGYNGIGEVTPSDDNKHVLMTGKCIKANNAAFLNLTNNEWKSHGDSMDIACLSLAHKLKIPDLEILEEIPYESEKKYSSATFKDNNKIYTTIKGSVEILINMCSDMYIGDKKVTIDKTMITKMSDDISSNGFRVLGVIVKEQESDNFTFLSLVASIDPIREDAASALDDCKKAGIKVVIITGDHPLTAFNIGKSLGLTNDFEQVKTGKDLEMLSDNEIEFDNLVKNTIIFARVSPMEKLSIIESFKRQGAFVAVTGDGVNDAPAMRSANIGIAMGSGTDVAKETSSMIIRDDSFVSIVAGIEEGRLAYNNIRKVIYMLVSCGFAEILFFILSILFGLPIPLLAVQLLWLNLVTDGIQDIALACEKGEKGVMLQPPRNPNESIFNKELIEEVLLSGTIIGVTIFILWTYLIYNNYNLNYARSFILIAMVFMQNIHSFNCRSETTSAFKMPLKNNYFILIGVLSALGLHLLITQIPAFSHILDTVPLTFIEIIYMFVISLPLLFVVELYKWFKRRKESL